MTRPSVHWFGSLERGRSSCFGRFGAEGKSAVRSAGPGGPDLSTPKRAPTADVRDSPSNHAVSEEYLEEVRVGCKAWLLGMRLAQHTTGLRFFEAG